MANESGTWVMYGVCEDKAVWRVCGPGTEEYAGRKKQQGCCFFTL